MNRPTHLPDFDAPPLNEVVLGLQFAPPRGYLQIYAGEVWNLFRHEFPDVKEQPPLPPNFETFGLPQTASVKFEIIDAMHSRFWFISRNESELIQFQQDRLLHNWRKVATANHPYPRFEIMVKKFENDLYSLEQYFTKFGSEKLSVNQCEITYINHISLTTNLDNKIESWLNFLNFQAIEPTDFRLEFRKTITDNDGNPLGRFICESGTAINNFGEPIITLNLTVRGNPPQPTIAAALDFLELGREKLVNYFDQLTTDFAHQQWGKK